MKDITQSAHYSSPCAGTLRVVHRGEIKMASSAQRFFWQNFAWIQLKSDQNRNTGFEFCRYLITLQFPIIKGITNSLDATKKPLQNVVLEILFLDY